MARAIRGEADEDRDGLVVKQELEGFVRHTVQQVLQGRQHPQIFPPGRMTVPVMVRSAAPPADGGQEPAAGADQTVTIQVVGVGADGLMDRLSPGLVDTILVPGGTGADLVLDAATGEMMSRLGDVVAVVPLGDHGVGADPGTVRTVQHIADRWRLVFSVGDHVDPAGPLIGFRDADDRSRQDVLFRAGQRVEVEIANLQAPYLTLFNIASDGTVNFLYPLAAFGDAPAVPMDVPMRLVLAPEAPFGADHFFAVASARPLPDVHARLAAMAGTASAAALAPLLDSLRATPGVHVAMHGLYTAAD